jgi:hypothetical protein
MAIRRPAIFVAERTCFAAGGRSAEVDRTMTPILRGIFLTSEHPERTAEFYRDIAGLPLERVGDPATYCYWKLDRNEFQIAIHGAREFAAYAYPCRPESNVTHLYFKIESQPQFLERLEQLGIVPTATDEIVVTVADPDGRMVLFGTA